MTGNDCLRRIRYILDLDDRKVINVFAEAECDVTREQISAWLKKDDDPDYELAVDYGVKTGILGGH